MPDSYSNPQTCDPVLIPTENSLNDAKGNRLFPGKARKDRALVLTNLEFIFVNYRCFQMLCSIF